MSKELYMRAHEQLIEEAMEREPTLTWERAYDTLADAAYDRMRDMYADRIDDAKQRAKDEGNWPRPAAAGGEG